MIDLFDRAAYLEIGVNRGKTFAPLKARRKVAIDPSFRFDTAAMRLEQPNSSFHEVTSDVYFASLPAHERFDVIYLDGLHTFEQTLRDLMNALSFITPDGIIVIDDVSPPNIYAANRSQAEAARLRTAAGVAGKAWMGDVYRLVVFVDTFLPRWSFACTTDNHGQMIMWQSPRGSVVERRVDEVGSLSWEAFGEEKASLNFMPLEDIVARIKQDRCPTDAG